MYPSPTDQPPQQGDADSFVDRGQWTLHALYFLLLQSVPSHKSVHRYHCTCVYAENLQSLPQFFSISDTSIPLRSNVQCQLLQWIITSEFELRYNNVRPFLIKTVLVG